MGNYTKVVALVWTLRVEGRQYLGLKPGLGASVERTFVVVWCSEGLECVEEITGQDKRAMWATLKDEEPKALTDVLKYSILRARFNPQRIYEIYTVTAVDGIKKKDIVGMFNNSPQTAADTIRRLGNKLYSDRLLNERVIT
jgi:hypothetical protein